MEKVVPQRGFGSFKPKLLSKYQPLLEARIE
jgi:hypothetical protein